MMVMVFHSYGTFSETSLDTEGNQPAYLIYRNLPGTVHLGRVGRVSNTANGFMCVNEL